ncbi:MAG TPA: hypothetical protein VGG34_11415 [Opitutaceae bacterium]
MNAAAQTAPRPRPAASDRFDLLRVPVIGRFLRWRWARMAVQGPVLVLSAIMIAHAIFGPQLAPKNLGALLTWVHFRGLVVLFLLLGGNFFCMACPFMLPRDLARRWVQPRWAWPKFLRTKWPAAILFAGILFTYEWASLWSDPWATGMLIIGYFAAAFFVDVFFKKASFCKYVCPVGQFNFLGSTLSPLEVAVREPGVCADCRTKDCIAGRRETGEGIPPLQRRIIQRGCELELFQPRKVGNLDCTFCMDCVHACPHDNVGIMARLPGEEIAATGERSGIGDLDGRGDWTALVVVFVFGAVLNAFAMISPVYALERLLSRVTGLGGRGPVLALLFGFALVVEPAVLLCGAAWMTRRACGSTDGLSAIINRYARTLVPTGFGVWLAHYGFHFLTGALTVIPVAQYAAEMATGHAFLGMPQWQLGGMPVAYVYPIELGFITVGFLGSLAVGWLTARRHAGIRAIPALAPWAAIALILFLVACWTMSQPMDMRVTFIAN